ncbi:MAG: histidinol-phosphate/aromatic aminotransferase/cobyric acid decarboxylase-like protein, partial [Candidatus Promineifilaceae bacterium]
HANVFGMPGYLRFSIGRQQDNERGIAALEKSLKKHGIL